ncbi:hypothetical protein TNCV_1135061 [Trichonephila clavipes]|nr:hypothetical protein TNCV_1135061 [Trichonephila clavipes]
MLSSRVAIFNVPECIIHDSDEENEMNNTAPPIPMSSEMRTIMKRARRYCRTDTIVKLKTKIENSSTFESDPDFVKTLIQNCIDERVSQNEREETATHIGIREAEDWFRPIDLAKECDIYISSRSGSHKEIPITYGYTQDPFKNRSQNFKPKVKENYPQYHERENKNCFICGDSSHCARDYLGAHAYAYSSAISFPNVSVSNVIENCSYDLPYVKNFNTGNDSSSRIKDYKCNKIKITKLKLSIVREKCSDIVLCKKANGAMKTSSVEFISRSPNPLPMKSEHRRFVLLRKIFEPWQWKRRKREIVLNRRPELYRGKYRCVQPKINLLKKMFLCR